MTQDQLSEAVDALILTNQLPLRALTREYKRYPYNEYRPSWGGFLATRAVEEVATKRKKAKGKQWFHFYHDEGTPPVFRSEVLEAEEVRGVNQIYLEARSALDPQLKALEDEYQAAKAQLGDGSGNALMHAQALEELETDFQARKYELKDSIMDVRDQADQAKAKVLALCQYRIAQDLKAALECHDKLQELAAQKQKPGLTQEQATAIEKEIEKVESDFPGIPNEELWSLEDFTDMIYTRAVCAWGECEFADKK